jgi:hypothetical protein
MKTRISFCMYLKSNSLNICWREKCFEQKLQSKIISCAECVHPPPYYASAPSVVPAGVVLMQNVKKNVQVYTMY